MGVYVIDRRNRAIQIFDTFDGSASISNRSPVISLQGHLWELVEGTLACNGSGRVAHGDTGDAQAVIGLEANGNIKATWIAGSTSGDDYCRLIFRRQSDNNWWEVLLGRVSGSNIWRLNEVTAGVATQRAFESFNYIAGAANVLDVTFDGLTITATYNGVKEITYTQASKWLGAAGVGFMLTMTGTIAAHSALDDFQGYRL